MVSSSEVREFAARIGEELLPAAPVRPEISLEQYYSEAGPDYAAWSPKFNMHFGYYCTGANPLRREAMLEQMNAEVLARLRVDDIAKPQLLDLGCGLGAALPAGDQKRSCSELPAFTGRWTRHVL